MCLQQSFTDLPSMTVEGQTGVLSPVVAMGFTPSSSSGDGSAASYFMANSQTAKPVAAVKGQLGGRGGRLIAVVKSDPSQQHLLPVLLLAFLWHQQNQQI